MRKIIAIAVLFIMPLEAVDDKKICITTEKITQNTAVILAGDTFLPYPFSSCSYVQGTIVGSVFEQGKEVPYDSARHGQVFLINVCDLLPVGFCAGVAPVIIQNDKKIMVSHLISNGGITIFSISYTDFNEQHRQLALSPLKTFETVPHKRSSKKQDITSQKTWNKNLTYAAAVLVSAIVLCATPTLRNKLREQSTKLTTGFSFRSHPSTSSGRTA